MSSFLRRSIALSASRSGLLDTYAFLRRELTKSQVAIVLYHRVCPEKDGWSLESLSVQAFDRQIRYLYRNFEVVPLHDIIHWITQHKPLPRKAVALTFDDGYMDNYLYAYPILKKYGVPFTIFLTTGYIGNDNLLWWDNVGYTIYHTSVECVTLNGIGNFCVKTEKDKLRTTATICEQLKKISQERKDKVLQELVARCDVDIPLYVGKDFFMSWDEVKEMSDNGVDFGAHTVNHHILTSISLRQAYWEIIQSKKDMGNRLNIEVKSFSYPNGDFNTEVLKLVKEAGFECALTGPDQKYHKLVNLRDNPFVLSRIGSIEDINEFKVILSGIWGDLQKILRYC